MTLINSTETIFWKISCISVTESVATKVKAGTANTCLTCALRAIKSMEYLFIHMNQMRINLFLDSDS